MVICENKSKKKENKVKSLILYDNFIFPRIKSVFFLINIKSHLNL